MFDLITQGHRRAGARDTTTLLLSLGFHVAMVVLVVVIPLLFVTASIPQVPSLMMAFVAAAPPPPPPPPPPLSEDTATPAVDMTPPAAPVEAPEGFAPEPPDTSLENVSFDEGSVGGITGGLASLEAPPPPAPPQSEPPLAPVRIGGAIKQPSLMSRVGPIYPAVAVTAHVEGVVILEVVVDREGRVEEVKILRSIPLLDMAAVDAVRQWRYAPLVVNGQPARFIVTVTVSFNLS
jgi:protein TonB